MVPLAVGIRALILAASTFASRTSVSLMTTVAIMMSAVPAILGLGPGAETRSPMAVVVLGGLTVSTLLSLLAVPCCYVVADRMKARLRPSKAATSEP